MAGPTDRECSPSPAPVATATVRAAGRIHLGLLAIPPGGGVSPEAFAEGRRFHGGVGFMVERPGVAVRVSLRDGAAAGDGGGAVAGSEAGHAAEQTARCERVARRCEERLGLGSRAHLAVELLESPRPHVGLGSGTQLSLAIAAAAAALPRAAGHTDGPNAENPDAEDSAALAALAGRGLRSSVGIHGFMRGGLLLEAGRRLPVIDGGPRPDGAGLRPGPLLARVPIPEAWRFVIAIPSGRGFSGGEEREAFARLAGTSQAVSAELARIALLELVPAVIEGDHGGFAAAVTRYGRLAGAPYESLMHSHPLGRLIAETTDWLESHGARGVAQTSWGPAVVACLASEAEAEDLVVRLLPEAAGRATEIVTTAACNRPASIRLSPA
jgi:beta-ribofuranosylaminobenzene 5'-phosphate synthase